MVLEIFQGTVGKQVGGLFLCAWNSWLEMASYIWPTQLGLGFLSSNESGSGDALTHWASWASKHVQPWRIVSMGSFAVIGLGGSSLNCGAPWNLQSSFQQAFSWKVWGNGRDHTGQAPISHPNHKNVPLCFLWYFKRHMEYKGHGNVFFFLSYFWK